MPPQGKDPVTVGTVATTIGQFGKVDTKVALSVLKSVRSVRDLARQEYGKVHAALAPLYNDIVSVAAPDDIPAKFLVFRLYDAPEDQAQMLSNLLAFSRSDVSPDAHLRRAKLRTAVDLFEAAALREFRYRYEAGDVDVMMKRYAHVLALLGRKAAAVDLFVEHNHIITHKGAYGSPLDSIRKESGAVSLEYTQAFLTRLHAAFHEQFSIMERSFGPSQERSKRFTRKIASDVLSPYLATLFDELHDRNIESYLKAVSGTFDQVDKFLHDLQPIYDGGDTLTAFALEVQLLVFEPHLHLYLAEEFYFFRKFSEATVFAWDQQLSRQEESAEILYMSNINRQADKKDFLTSFKKVLMNPVSMFPNRSSSSKSDSPVLDTRAVSSRKPSSDASISNQSMASPTGSSIASDSLPTTELAAKAAIMNSKLESIRSLFSIDVALSLVNAAKTSLERTALFVKLGGTYGRTAREQCETIFVLLLQNLGHQHVVAGFAKAIDRLSVYRRKEQRGHAQIMSAVDSLVKFLELVNVGDLILQMLNAFYEQEMIGTKLVTQDDFLSAPAKEKKRLEQILDENVAVGLNKGIDVLIDHVEYALATKQQSTDFNPEGARVSDPSSPVIPDVGPSEAATEVVNIISSHTRILVGNTDKGTFDVFNQEIGSRLFTSLCKHIKKQRISVSGAVKLISDMNFYFRFIQTMRNENLALYFIALRELAQVYLINSSDSKEMASVITDIDRYHGVFRAEEVYEFATRRADWYQVKAKVNSAMYGIGCFVM